MSQKTTRSNMAVRYRATNRYGTARDFTNRRDAERYAAAERRDGWPSQVRDLRCERERE